jgi:hypothetical protein
LRYYKVAGVYKNNAKRIDENDGRKNKKEF